ncbi:MAG: chromosomal replication initiator protein DnaA [Candidatus Krumholzibacteriota bacterium]|nr:chromosomal replication initiator protein DnaA [Candidatus Krumholzibacteriota bacterium]
METGKEATGGCLSGPESLLQIWEAILKKICAVVNNQSFQTWFKPTRLVGYENGSICIEGPNTFFIDWLAEHHIDKIQSAAHEVLGEKVNIEFKASPSASRVTPPSRPPLRPSPAPRPAAQNDNLRLNPRYTFSEFVAGSGNRLTHAAALAVAEKPASTYNPLFIYGGAGLGKTHLLQAIGHFVREEHPAMRISYVSTESFVNELIHAIRTGSTLEFKKKYRDIDILLIDDIHFLAGKESTQEEFFFTFNSLYDANRQIVCTSDRPPKEIPTLQERLVSRFEWGLTTDIQPPDLETRIAILSKKVEKERIHIPASVIQVIAENVKSNIRELEGSLIRILAHSSINCREITPDMALEVLKDIMRGGATKISVKSIQQSISQHFDVPAESLRAKTRISRVVLARQVAIYLARELTSLSLVQIGKSFGGRDHSTVLHSLRKVEKLAADDPSLRKRIQTIRQELTRS